MKYLEDSSLIFLFGYDIGYQKHEEGFGFTQVTFLNGTAFSMQPNPQTHVDELIVWDRTNIGTYDFNLPPCLCLEC